MTKNQRRRTRAKRALDSHNGVDIRSLTPDDRSCACVDLIADVLHYASHHGHNAKQIADLALMHVEAEKGGGE